MTNLIILAPFALHRQAWRALFLTQPDINIIAVVEDASQATTLIVPGKPTTIFIDLHTPQPELARQIKSLVPECGLVFLVPSYELSQVIPLLQAGATGCISRHESVADLARAIIAAGRGEIVLPPAVAVQSLMALAQGQPVEQSLVGPLSERETEVLKLLAHGHTNKDIAQALFLSVRTVEAHLRSIFAKLGVSSRTEAALWAVQHGYSS